MSKDYKYDTEKKTYKKLPKYFLDKEIYPVNTNYKTNEAKEIYRKNIRMFFGRIEFSFIIEDIFPNGASLINAKHWYITTMYIRIFSFKMHYTSESEINPATHEFK
jgi:hypothetical protein